MQYGVQNDRPCCGHGRKFWTVNINFLASLTEADLQVLLYISTVKRSRRCICHESSEARLGWRCQWPQEKWPMHSMLSFCQFQTSLMLHYIPWMNGRREVPCSVEVLAVERCDELEFLWMSSLNQIQSTALTVLANESDGWKELPHPCPLSWGGS